MGGNIKITDKQFQEKLATLVIEDIVEIANHELIDELKREILLEQEDEYRNYLMHLFDKEVEGKITKEVLDKIKKSINQLKNDDLYDFFSRFAYPEFIIPELLYIKGENRKVIIDRL